jgi:hypothetical protein
LKGLCVRKIRSYNVMVSCTYGLLPNPANPKSQISNVWHDGTLSIRNFILMVKELKNQNFEPLTSIGPYWPSSDIRQKSKISNIEHDCTLSNRNFKLKIEKPKNLGFEPVHSKNVSLASVVHRISGLFSFKL